MAKAKQDDPKQSAAFRKAARELGADESKEEFQNVLRTLAKAKPKDKPPDDDDR